jgi:hypothetical protein
MYLLLTSGKHALDEVLDIAENNPITFWIACALRSERLDLHTLAYWDRECTLKLFGVVENGTAMESVSCYKKNLMRMLTQVRPVLPWMLQYLPSLSRLQSVFVLWRAVDRANCSRCEVRCKAMGTLVDAT